MSGRREVTSGPVGTNPDMEKALRKVRKGGWRVFITGGNHILVLGPEGQRCTLSLTTSGGGTKAGLRQLKRAGAPV